jgi:lysozyme
MEEKIKDFLKRWEGCRLKAYRCPGGVLTIGYGHRIIIGEKIPDVLSEEEAVRLLEEDIARAYLVLRRLVKVSLCPWQEGALISFIFNMGSGAFQRSLLRSKVNREEHEEVPPEFLKWIWAGGVRHRGLLRRRYEEAIFYGRGKL